MRIAVTGARGRLGRALVRALEESPFTGPFGPIGWGRDAFDLDRPEVIGSLLDREDVELVVHCAGWTDAVACAREPDLAMRRNGAATGVVAAACASRGIDLVLVSTNEVFDGRRRDGRGYRHGDPPSAGNAYGASSLAGERAAAAAHAAAGARGALGIIRTAWLFGSPGADFPSTILAAAARARAAGLPLRVVADEIGTPTYLPDLAEGICELIASDAVTGIHHLVNAGAASRASWAADLLARARIDVGVQEIGSDEPASDTARDLGNDPAVDSASPAWGVLEPTPMPSGEPLRPWREAQADYLPSLLRAVPRRGR